jgi:hypothetical protein
MSAILNFIVSNRQLADPQACTPEFIETQRAFLDIHPLGVLTILMDVCKGSNRAFYILPSGNTFVYTLSQKI